MANQKPPRRVPGSRSSTDSGREPLNHAHEQMLGWLRKVRFRRNLLGGVNERDLWKKLEELNDLYDSAISAERARYDALLAAQQKSANDALTKYKAALAETREKYNELVRRVKASQAAKTQKPGDSHGEAR